MTTAKLFVRALSAEESAEILTVLAQHTSLDQHDRTFCDEVLEAIHSSRGDLHARLSARTDKWLHKSEIQSAIAELERIERAVGTLVDAIMGLGPLSKTLLRGTMQYVGGDGSFLNPPEWLKMESRSDPWEVGHSRRAEMTERAASAAYQLKLVASDERAILESVASKPGAPEKVAEKCFAWELASVWMRLGGDPRKTDTQRTRPFDRFVGLVGRTVRSDFSGRAASRWVYDRLVGSNRPVIPPGAGS